MGNCKNLSISWSLNIQYKFLGIHNGLREYVWVAKSHLYFLPFSKSHIINAMKILNLDGVVKQMEIQCLSLLANRYWQLWNFCMWVLPSADPLHQGSWTYNFTNQFKYSSELTADSCEISLALSWTLYYIVHDGLVFLLIERYCPKRKDQYRVIKMNTGEWSC